MASARSEKTGPFIIVILGCTGTGKSKLSIEIARQIGGEIISADSMQVYKGLDIITNKVTPEERALIPHYFLDFVEANQRFSVVEFRNMALNMISYIHSRQKVPIIVGGTNYYIESLLWENLIDERREFHSSDAQVKFQKVENLETQNHGVPNFGQNLTHENMGNVILQSWKVGNRNPVDDEESERTVYQTYEKLGGNTNNFSAEISENKIPNKAVMEKPYVEKEHHSQQHDSKLQVETDGRAHKTRTQSPEDASLGRQTVSIGTARVNDTTSENTLLHQRQANSDTGTSEPFLRQQIMQTFASVPSVQTRIKNETLDCSGKLSPVKQLESSKRFPTSVIIPLAEQYTSVCKGSFGDTPLTQQTINTGTISKINDNETQNDSLHQKLAKVDSAMAKKLHPNDTRKIKRSLQVFEQSGIPHSEHLARQHFKEGSSQYGGPMRFKNVCVLWLRCEFETLDKRLDARVEQMIQQGLVEELLDFQSSCENDSSELKIHHDEGIFQSIGFKEFKEFLKHGNGKVEEHPKLFQECVAAMKCNTRRYARKQVRWVTNRFLGRPPASSPDVYGLDATDLSQWRSNVLEKALDIVKSFQGGQQIGHSSLERVLTNTEEKHSNHICAICNGRIIIGDQNWEAHLRSKSHRHYKTKQQRLNDVRS